MSLAIIRQDKCKHFNDDRLLYLGKKQFKNVNMYSFSHIMNINNVAKLKKLSLFAEKIMLFFSSNYVRVTTHARPIQAQETRSGRSVVPPNRLNL